MSDLTDKKDDLSEFRFSRSEAFEVVLVKKGVDPLSAKPEEFRRVHVTAGSPTDAVASKEVEAAEAEGWRSLQAVNPTNLTEFEQMARARAAASSEMGRPRDL